MTQTLSVGLKCYVSLLDIMSQGNREHKKTCWQEKKQKEMLNSKKMNPLLDKAGFRSPSPRFYLEDKMGVFKFFFAVFLVFLNGSFLHILQQSVSKCDIGYIR